MEHPNRRIVPKIPPQKSIDTPHIKFREQAASEVQGDKFQRAAEKGDIDATKRLLEKASPEAIEQALQAAVKKGDVVSKAFS